MTNKWIDPQSFSCRPFNLLDQEWALLVGGSCNPNPMTVSWGGFGTLWHLPVVTVYVRPTRFTFGLLEKDDEFTLNFFPENYKEALKLCGTKSGRDMDKWKETGLTQVAGEKVSVPRIEQAHLSFECRTLATFDIDPERFLDKSIEKNYPEKDYHTIFIGKVEGIIASEQFTG